MAAARVWKSLKWFYFNMEPWLNGRKLWWSERSGRRLCHSWWLVIGVQALRGRRSQWNTTMSKSQASATVHPNPDGTVSVQYVPKESGAHDLNVTYNDIPVAGKSQPTHTHTHMVSSRIRAETICAPSTYCRHADSAVLRTVWQFY